MDSRTAGGEALRRLPGFDYARAIMAATVIVWHTNLFTPAHMPPGFGSLRSLFCLYFLLLPVPAFFMMSGFLFSLKVEGNRGYVFRRLERLAYLFLFWSTLWILIAPDKGVLLVKAALDLPFWNALGFFCCWGIGAYYFFSSLLVITVLIVFSSRLPPWALWSLLGLSLAFLAGIPPYAAGSKPLYFLTIDSTPTNFLAFAFAGPLMAHYYKKGYFDGNADRMRNLLLLVSVAFVAGVMLEHSVLSYFKVPEMPRYTRPAPIIGAILVFVAALTVRRTPGRVIRFLSDHSLGMYCTHPLIKMTYILFVGYEPRGELAYTLTVLPASILASVVLRRAFSRGLI